MTARYFHDSDLDIVTRLRRWADIYAHHNVPDELLEAAGEIIRLRQQIAPHKFPDAVTGH